MNNSVDFVKNFTSDNISSIVTRFFDEIMVLYNLIGDRHDLDICTDDSASIATFRILMESEDEAKSMYEDLNGSDFEVYGNKFGIMMTLSGCTITTVISKR